MRRVFEWLLGPVAALFAGAGTSGAESCEYLARLRAVPALGAHEERRAA